MTILGESNPSSNDKRPAAVFLYPIEDLRSLSPSEAVSLYDKHRPPNACPERDRSNQAYAAEVRGNASEAQRAHVNTLEYLTEIIWSQYDHLPGS
jgi:hypothetical protein